MDLLSRFAEASDLHQSPMHARLMEHIGWHVEGDAGSQIFYRTLGPIAIAKIQRPQSVDVEWLTSFRKKHHVLTTYVEPGLSTKLPIKMGMRVEPFANSMTSIVDISSPATLLASFTQKTRYNITRTQKRGEISIESVAFDKLTDEQIKAFFDLRAQWTKRKKVIGYSEETLHAVFHAYGEHGTLHSAYHGNELVGDLMILHYQKVSTYYSAFATEKGNKLFAPTLLTWHAMVEAQKNGSQIFDFGGIYDPRYPKLYKNWQGFTRFKAGFNPTPVVYPPTALQLFW